MRLDITSAGGANGWTVLALLLVIAGATTMTFPRRNAI
jgi:hypothetical protein